VSDLYSSNPLYKTIAGDLIQKIEDAVYPKGKTLPTEEKLTKIYHVSRVTIRQAIQVLVEKNYVKKRQGSGSQVVFSKNSFIIERSAKILPFSEEMRALGKPPSCNVLSFQIIVANKNLLSQLELAEHDQVYNYKRILMANGYPYCFEEGFIPVKPFSDLTLEHLSTSKIGYFEKTKGIMIDYSHQIVHAVLPSETLCTLLQVENKKPLLQVTNITYQMNGIPLDKTIITFDSEIYPASFIKRRA
jgi:DNA-binding GntR family transcriptional regulator